MNVNKSWGDYQTFRIDLVNAALLIFLNLGTLRCAAVGSCVTQVLVCSLPRWQEP